MMNAYLYLVAILYSSFTQLLRGLNNLRKSNLLKEEFEIYCGTRLIDIHPNNIKHLKHLN
jgi:hypothetical protein